MRSPEPFPVFPMRMPCPGFKDWIKGDGGKYHESVVFCHEQKRRVIRVNHGFFIVDLSVCLHVCNNDLGACFKEDVSGFLSEHYDGVTNEPHRAVHGVVALTRGTCWKYYWEYTTRRQCDNCGLASSVNGDEVDLRYTKEFATKPRSAISECLSRPEDWLENAKDCLKKLSPIQAEFCSAECASKYFRRGCPHCGTHNADTLTDRYSDYKNKIYTKADAGPMLWNFCSRQCCSLALNGYLQQEREKRHRKIDLKCVQEVKKVLSKAKRSLQKQCSQEALQSLKKEFEQAGSLR